MATVLFDFYARTTALTPFRTVLHDNASTANPTKRGARTISGTVKRAGVGEVARVYLLDQSGLSVVAETISDASGNWAMPGGWSANFKFVELALDKTEVDNAAIKAPA